MRIRRVGPDLRMEAMCRAHAMKICEERREREEREREERGREERREREEWAARERSAEKEEKEWLKRCGMSEGIGWEE